MIKIDHFHAQFKSLLGYELDLIQPKTFSEKIQWIKLFHQDPLLTRCSDKIAVKSYVREKLGRDICIPTLKTFRSPDEFKLAEMPPKFVLKLNNASGAMLFYEGPHSFTEERIRELNEEWLHPSFSHYAVGLEWGYKHIVPEMLVEPLVPGLGKLDDYKFFCFGGEPRFLYVATRINGLLHVTFFDLEWNVLPYHRGSNPPIPHPVPRPEKFEEMCAVARRLSEDFFFVRVDLYHHEKQVLFGELTFYPGSGYAPFKPDELEHEIGSWITLPDHLKFFIEETGATVLAPRAALPAFLDLASPLHPTQPDPAIETLRLADKIARMQSSFSWRITAPLRFARRAVTRFFK